MPARTYESLAHAAERAEVSVKTLRRRIATGDLPAYRCGSKLLRVDPNDVDRLMNPLFGGSRHSPRSSPTPHRSQVVGGAVDAVDAVGVVGVDRSRFGGGWGVFRGFLIMGGTDDGIDSEEFHAGV